MRFCNVYLVPRAADERGQHQEAYDAFWLLRGHTHADWSVQDPELAEHLGDVSIPLDELITEMSPEEVVTDLTALVQQRWPAARVWLSEEDV